MRCLDSSTVEKIQSKAPGCSGYDLAILETAFQEGKLFPTVQNPEDRRAIWNNLVSIQVLIPSLYTFFEDLKYLRASVKILRQLCPPSNFSMKEAMWRIFSEHNLPNDEYLIEISEDKYERINPPPADRFEFSYQILVLACWRHWPQLIAECPKKEADGNTPIPQSPDPRMWWTIAARARRLGFESDEISRLLSQDPDREFAREALLKARSPDYFSYGEFDESVAKLVVIFKSAKEILSEPIEPNILVPGCGESPDRRCGRVFNNAYEQDRRHLFLRYLYKPSRGEGGGISSFAVRSSVFFRFFGQKLPVGSIHTRGLSEQLELVQTKNSMRSSHTITTGTPKLTKIQSPNQAEPVRAGDPTRRLQTVAPSTPKTVGIMRAASAATLADSTPVSVQDAFETSRDSQLDTMMTVSRRA
jgi:hypothetical protein